MLYVTTELDDAITVVDPKKQKVVGSIPTGQGQSHMFVISRDGKLGYTANVSPGSVSVLDIPGRKTIAVIPNFQSSSANCNFTRRQVGVYFRPDSAPDGSHRYSYESDC
jgi:DNA-binding beta-propeller fold protein YncE